MKKSNLALLLFALAVIFFSAGVFFNSRFGKDPQSHPNPVDSLPKSEDQVVAFFKISELKYQIKESGCEKYSKITFYNGIESENPNAEPIAMAEASDERECSCIKDPDDKKYFVFNSKGDSIKPIGVQEAKQYRQNLQSQKIPGFSNLVDVDRMEQSNLEYVGLNFVINKFGRPTFVVFKGIFKNGKFEKKEAVGGVNEPCPIACPTNPDNDKDCYLE